MIWETLANTLAARLLAFVSAGYLFYLVGKVWTAVPAAFGGSGRAIRRASVVGHALIARLINPKPPVFLRAFLPQFTWPEDGPVW